MGVLPDRLLRAYMQVERFGIIIVFVLVYGGLLDRVINPVASLLLRFFQGE